MDLARFFGRTRASDANDSKRRMRVSNFKRKPIAAFSYWQITATTVPVPAWPGFES